MGPKVTVNLFSTFNKTQKFENMKVFKRDKKTTHERKRNPTKSYLEMQKELDQKKTF